MNDLKDKIIAALKSVETSGGDVVSSNMIGDLQISDARDVLMTLEVDPAMGASMEPLRQSVENTIKAVKGVKSASVILTAERKALPEPDPHGMNKNPRLILPFKHVIAVGSGKGGVGKSTVAFNLAVELAAKGLKVALLDADIYGPSLPILSGVSGKPQTNAQGKIVPPEAHGIKLMSMGFMVEDERPMIWRGPMVQTAFYQMLRDVAWQNENETMDVLVIDMPPGTGDVQLTLAQKVPVTGAIIVSTPQDLALIDARKAIAMFEKTGVKILGLIENMSFHICPNCGHEDHIFGHGGARAEAAKRCVPFLGEIPLSAQIREESDQGKKSDEPSYGLIADAVLKLLQ